MASTPNTFIDENGALVFVNVCEMMPEDIGDIAESKAYCNTVERHFGTNDIDEMMRKGMSYKAMRKYICARHTLIEWGYKPEDWKA